jgi:hypothetical protein
MVVHLDRTDSISSVIHHLLPRYRHLANIARVARCRGYLASPRSRRAGKPIGKLVRTKKQGLFVVVHGDLVSRDFRR